MYIQKSHLHCMKESFYKSFTCYVEFHITGKAAVEGAVGDCTIAIVGKLRNRKFFSFDDLNAAILKELDVFNNKPFQKKRRLKKISLSG